MTGLIISQMFAAAKGTKKTSLVLRIVLQVQGSTILTEEQSFS
jgi:hypothetical protein